MNKRVKNVYFWIGVIGVIFTASGINPETITSWDILIKNILSVLSNPYLLASVVMAIIGIVVDPTTPGIKDKEEK